MNPKELSLADRVAVVTGGSRGIGRATAELFAMLGAKIVVNYAKDEAAAQSVVASIEKIGSESIPVKADVSRIDEGQRLIDAALAHFGRVDILICNAGIWQGAPADELREELWDHTMEINLKGVWSVCRAAIPHMKKRREGKIVIVSSTAGQRGEANYSNYAASKGALIAFTKSLASELGEWGINVNAVAPGWVDTDMTNDALGGSEERDEIARSIPIGEIASAGDIAGPIAFLCTAWARHITGEVLNVNGGSVLCG
ncbi:MAG TPA: 3-oxoacyl-ACP reductase family protein [Pyrinomonadaceae bacterium]|nr:3-oxoacyl-ACP reductase family protein [Pyrinomonadaceae bacterium]